MNILMLTKAADHLRFPGETEKLLHMYIQQRGVSCIGPPKSESTVTHVLQILWVDGLNPFSRALPLLT